MRLRNVDAANIYKQRTGLLDKSSSPLTMNTIVNNHLPWRLCKRRFT